MKPSNCAHLSQIILQHTQKHTTSIQLSIRLTNCQYICWTATDLPVKHTMSRQVVHLQYPSDADIEWTQEQLQGSVVPRLVPDLLFYAMMPEGDRGRLIKTFQCMSMFTPEHQTQLLSLVSKCRSSRFGSGIGSFGCTPGSAPEGFPFANASLSSFVPATSATSRSLISSSDGALIHGILGSHHRNNDTPYNHSFRLDGYSPPITTGISTAQTTPLPFATDYPSVPTHMPGSTYHAAYDNDSMILERPTYHSPAFGLGTTIGQSSPISAKTAKRKAGRNPNGKELRKFICPVCGRGCTRFNGLKTHVQNICLNPKSYMCLGCNMTSPHPEDIEKHRKSSDHCSRYRWGMISPLARKKYASSLTGKLFDTAAGLMEDARKHCASFKESVPQSSQDLRLRVLLGEDHIKELNQIIEHLCWTFTGIADLWRMLKWPEALDAQRLANRAEFEVQGAGSFEVYNDMSIIADTPSDNFKQLRPGISNLKGFAMEVLQKSDWEFWFIHPRQSSVQQYLLAVPSGSLAAHSAVASTTGNTSFNTVDSVTPGLQVHHPGFPQLGQLLQQGLTVEQPFNQGLTQSLMRQNHNLQPGIVYTGPIDEDMQDFDSMTTPDCQSYAGSTLDPYMHAR